MNGLFPIAFVLNIGAFKNIGIVSLPVFLTLFLDFYGLQ